MASNCATESNDVTQADAAISSGGDLDEYKMKHADRGYAVIINNKNFTKTEVSERKGTDKDCERVESLLRTLGFQEENIKTLKDATKDDMLGAMKAAAAKNYDNKDCFVCIILSHGDQDIVLSSDCEEVPLSLLALEMGRKKCKKLARKPKIFIVQACSGKKLDRGVTQTVTQHDGDSQNQADATSDEVSDKLWRNEPDFLIAYASVEGYYSWREEKEGSLFIQYLVDVIGDNWRQEDLLSMLTEVNDKVAHDEKFRLAGYDVKSEKNFLKQMPFFHSLLTKKLFFHTE